MEETHTRRINWTKELCAEEALKYPSRRKFQKGCQGAYQKAYKMNWLEEICMHMKAPYKPNGYWTKERCAKEAAKYTKRYVFQQVNPSAYNKARQEGWLDEICSHMEVKRRERSYWDKEKCQEEALKYKTRKEFAKGCCSAYNASSVHGWLDEICKHMQPLVKPVDDWTMERCQEEALKYSSRTDFKRKCPSAFIKAKKEGWLDIVCEHMKKKNKLTKEACAIVAGQFDKRTEFRRHKPSVFAAAMRNGWLDEICEHMSLGRIKWTKEKCQEEALKYDRLSDFKKQCPAVYRIVKKNRWLTTVTSHMKADKTKWTKKRCKEEALKFNSRAEFVKHKPVAYKVAKEKGWLDNICKHMKTGRTIWTKDKCAEEAWKYNVRSEFAKRNPSAYNAARKNGWLDEICSHMKKRKNNKNTIVMENIKITELEKWLVDYITDFIHSCEAENSEEFNKWAKSFNRDEAEFVVGMEYGVDWGYEQRTEIPKEEAVKYAEVLIKKILNSWYL